MSAITSKPGWRVSEDFACIGFTARFSSARPSLGAALRSFAFLRERVITRATSRGVRILRDRPKRTALARGGSVHARLRLVQPKGSR